MFSHTIENHSFFLSSLAEFASRWLRWADKRLVTLDCRGWLACTAAALLGACGGGGGGSEPLPGGSPPPPQVFQSALDFENPSQFINGEPYTASLGALSFSGQLNSVAIPRGFCPDSEPPQDFSVRWTNVTTGQSGTSPVLIRCVTILIAGEPVPGVSSFFSSGTINLAPDANRIRFDTFDGPLQIGRDEVVVIREDNAAPAVSFNYPSDGESGVPINHALVAVFSESMDEDTLTPDRFSVIDDAGVAVAGQVSYDARSAAWLFRPDSPLNPSSNYDVSISGDVEDAGGGNALENEFAWRFETGAETDTVAPSAQRHWPGANCNCAPISTRLLVQLDEVIDPTSVSESAMRLSDGLSDVSGQTAYRGDYLEFMVSGQLTPGQTYTLDLSASIQDMGGQARQIDYSWQFETDMRPPVGSWSDTEEDGAPEPMAGHTAVWTGSEVIVWGAPGGGRYDPAADTWFVTLQGGITMNDPSPRRDHSAVWTGSEMIIWGGRAGQTPDSEVLAGGGAYDPAQDAWTAVDAPASATSFPTYNHVAIWTGTEMIVWGGLALTGVPASLQPVNSGWRYDPATGIVSAFTGADAPTARSDANAIWTGNEMIVWGGIDENGDALNDGARYDPVTDSWTVLPDISNVMAPSLPSSIVWTGSEAIVWNGGNTEPDQTANNRFRQTTLQLYDPALDSWRSSNSGWEPYMSRRDFIIGQFFAEGYIAFWTGDRMLAVSRFPGQASYLYDPVLDSWEMLSEVVGTSHIDAAAVWAGDRFVFWGGVFAILPSDEGLVWEY